MGAESIIQVDGKDVSLTSIELRFLSFLQHEVSWGEVVVIVREGRPRRAKILEKQFVFDRDNRLEPNDKRA